MVQDEREDRQIGAAVPTSRLGRTWKFGQMVARIGADVAMAGGKAALRKLDDAAGFSEAAHLKAAEHMLETLGELKGAMLKLGQILSYIDDGLPAPYKKLLAKLQAEAPTMGYDTVCAVVEAELGRSPEEVFAWFDPQPLAAASIGQVHRARLRDGGEVVVKVQFPGIAEAIEADIKNAGFLYYFTQVAARNVTASDLKAELFEVLLAECDYRTECANQQQFRRIWDGHDVVYVPGVYPELSTARLLTSEFVPGVRFQEFEARADQRTKDRVGFAMLDFTWHSLLYHCLFNGDPHPGNYIFRDDGRIAFLDYGCVKRFDQRTNDLVKHLLHAVHHNDVDELLETKRQLGSLDPGTRVPSSEIMKIYRYLHRPWLKDEAFTYTPEYTRESFAMLVANPAARAIRLPRQFIFVNRWQWGLNAVLASLRARGNFHAIIREFV